jgi:O-antigen ligase
MTPQKTAQYFSWLAGAILALMPFHAFLTVWLASGIGYYTALRLWKELLLVLLAAGSIYLLTTDKKLRQKILNSRLFQLVAVYVLISLTWGLGAYLLDKTTPKALGFGLAVNLRFLVFFMTIWVIATKSQWLEKMWPKLLFISAAVVLTVGFLQRFILPYDVLRHFGYNESTIFPYQTINHDIHYPRIMSTLRGANPLGAYLVLIISAITVMFWKMNKHRRLWGVFGLAALAVMFFSHSRAAWIGLLLALAALAVIKLSSKPLNSWLAVTVIGFILLVSGIAYGLRNNDSFENYLFHTNDKSTVQESSNEEHVSAFRDGLKQAAAEPLGRGVGTAGPASVYNHGKARVAENYYIQIAQETGWLGLALFLAIVFLTARELWYRRRQSLPLILFISLVGISAVNLVSHAWTDDTLAYLWWGLAGIALAKSKNY